MGSNCRSTQTSCFQSIRGLTKLTSEREEDSMIFPLSCLLQNQDPVIGSVAVRCAGRCEAPSPGVSER
jgi:hypothetical protein